MAGPEIRRRARSQSLPTLRIFQARAKRRNPRAIRRLSLSPWLRRVHCTVLNSVGTLASPSRVSSMTTGNRNAFSSAIVCVRCAASFHSNRKYPSCRAWVFAEMTGINSAHYLDLFRIFASHDRRRAVRSGRTTLRRRLRATPRRSAARPPRPGMRRTERLPGWIDGHGIKSHRLRRNSRRSTFQSAQCRPCRPRGTDRNFYGWISVMESARKRR